MESFDQDPDTTETQEWLDSIDSVIREHGIERARFLLKTLAERATRNGLPLPYSYTTPYRNSIPLTEEVKMPGDLFLERRIRSLIRWNALAMVLRANESGDDLGGHISSFSSSATLYDVGFNYFFRAPNQDSEKCPHGDLIYYQGHISPGIYARSFLEGRLEKEQLENFRREVDGKGLSSYPHPRLMPDYWQFPTVSMGLGPLQAIYQAHFMRYMSARELTPRLDRKVWAFLGDGECDEPESLGAIALAGREKLENLIFVVNCNLQRLDGPVRGNGKIIQELEGTFRGAGWNVIKVVWGRHWDPLFAKDEAGFMQKRMDEVVDGEFQNYKSKGGAYTREHFFGKYPELAEMVAGMKDDEIFKLNRGGHDPYKVYAAYRAAAGHKGQPTVILAHTIKGYGMGDAAEGKMDAHSVKKLDIESLKGFRDRFDIPISDNDLKDVPYYRPPADSPEMVYMRSRREKLGGFLPVRHENKEVLTPPKLESFAAQLKGSADKSISSTMAFVRILSNLVKDKSLGERVVPIVPDEARTFGMEGLFRQLGIYSSEGQLYEPVDFGQMMYYKEDKKGRIMEEGINEAGAFSAWLSAATAYSTYDKPMVPFYIFYSMFGFQRVGDLSWAAGDCQAQGFLIGATAGRTTLNGEGLQHQDGHSHILANTIPNCVTYDPTFGFELAVIIQDGLRRMYENHERVFYYITVMNESYRHLAMPEGAEEGIRKGLYLLKPTLKPAAKSALSVQLMGSGTILNEVLHAQQILQDDYGIHAQVWSAPSINEVAREGRQVERENLLNPGREKTCYLHDCLNDSAGPVICASDYMKQYAEQLRAYMPAHKTYVTLGTDGFGRSDSREKLRRFFEVDRQFIVVAALTALLKDGKIKQAVLEQALSDYEISHDKLDPLYN
ncbi:MAG: pyruvate dehydrogenase (acetyl-transferring), homodimeric type [Bermanella sp.]